MVSYLLKHNTASPTRWPLARSDVWAGQRRLNVPGWRRRLGHVRHLAGSTGDTAPLDRIPKQPRNGRRVHRPIGVARLTADLACEATVATIGGIAGRL